MRAVLYRSVAFLLLGMLLGAGFTNMMIGAQVDYLSLANRNLQEQLADTQFQLRKLQEGTDRKNKHSISSVETYLLMNSREGLTDYDQFRVELEVSKKVKEWLTPLIGQEVEKLDSLLVPQIIDNRVIEADGNRFRLTTHLVVVNQKTTVYVKATLLKGEAGKG